MKFIFGKNLTFLGRFLGFINRFEKMFYWRNLKSFYGKTGIEDIASFYQVQRVLHSDRFDFTVICQIAFFLNLGVNILVNPILTKKQIKLERNTHYMKNKTKIDWSTYHQETAQLLLKCKAVFQKYSESYEENWARRIVWAYDKLKKEKHKIYWSDIRKLSGVKRVNIDKLIPFIEKYTDAENVETIIKIIG